MSPPLEAQICVCVGTTKDRFLPSRFMTIYGDILHKRAKDVLNNNCFIHPDISIMMIQKLQTQPHAPAQQSRLIRLSIFSAAISPAFPGQ